MAMQDYSFRPRTEDGYPGRGYRFVSDRWIVYPFGHGLSFDSFSFDWLADHTLGGRCQVGLRVQPLYSKALRTRSSSTSVLLFLVPPFGQVWTPEEACRLPESGGFPSEVPGGQVERPLLRAEPE